MIFTSNFATNRMHRLNGISISRYPDRRSGFNGPEFPPLFPAEGLLKAYKDGEIKWTEYRRVYQGQLACLRPQEVVDRLHEIAMLNGTHNVILLCYESAKTLERIPCHRRLVAEWIESSLDIRVPEWSQENKEAIA
jgi:uncharacterized protein YeaO (DUF488 family)